MFVENGKRNNKFSIVLRRAEMLILNDIVDARDTPGEKM